MRTLSNPSLKMTAAAGCAILAAGIAPCPSAGSDEAVTVELIGIQGNRIQVGVANTTGAEVRGTLHLSVATDAGVEEASLDFLVDGHGQSSAVFSMAADVRAVIALGAIVDDGAPF